MSLDADPTPRDEPQSSKLKPQNVDPIDELRRLIGDRDPKQ
jgi:hypothetical protein